MWVILECDWKSVGWLRYNGLIGLIQAYLGDMVGSVPEYFSSLLLLPVPYFILFVALWHKLFLR